MKIRILSDLHIEFAKFRPKPVGEDVVVLAGDIKPGCGGVDWASRFFRDVPVIYVPGNHEFYGRRRIGETIDKMKAFTAEHAPNIHVLDNEAVLIDGVRFLGATLWTDFELFGCLEPSMIHASDRMNDYYQIASDPRVPDVARSYGPYVFTIRPSRIRERHQASIGWLREHWAEPFAGETVVVTHHAPSARSLRPERRCDPIAAAYASHLDGHVLSSGAALWIHGHIHVNQDYRIGTTRVMSNPRGYWNSDPNRGFDPNLIVEVGAEAEAAAAGGMAR